MNKDPQTDALETIKPENEVRLSDDRRFSAAMDNLIRDSEDTRLNFMQKHRSRAAIAMSFGLLSILVGASGFGWFLLMEADLAKAVASMILAFVLPLFLNFWSEQPLKAYTEDYKANFMPKMAKALGGLKFHPARGISAQILNKTGVLPAYDSYEAEDCFMGRYKGAKLIFSEAKLVSKKNRKGPVFDGVFVLLEISENMLEGHTIVTADRAMAKQYGSSRWKKLQPVTLNVNSAEADRFVVYSDKPDTAALLVGENFLKELSEASDAFEKSLLTAVLFRGKYIFLMIPHSQDMFEASNVYVPVTTKKHALTCKKEIERILEIIDVLEIYQTGSSPQTS